jgi:hypothetical protein
MRKGTMAIRNAGSMANTEIGNMVGEENGVDREWVG